MGGRRNFFRQIKFLTERKDNFFAERIWVGIQIGHFQQARTGSALADIPRLTINASTTAIYYY